MSAELQPKSDHSPIAELEREVARRRTFAIISHPDAGKTTLTEKLLLYAGAIELAGAVRGRKDRRPRRPTGWSSSRSAASRSRPPRSSSSSQGRRMSLLDTPGHKDFSEDTYRALIAADSVVMVIDAANGVEEQTRKLFEVCRRHRLPILTFVNKFDRPAAIRWSCSTTSRRTLGIAAAPVNWPIGNAERFRGVYDIQRQTLLLYEREAQGQYRAPVDISSTRRSGGARADRRERLRAFPRIARRHPRRRHAVRRRRVSAPARQTPVFFGSALTNFGLEPFLQALVELAPPPQPRPSDSGDRGADRRALHRLRLQDSGEHGSAPSRSRRVRPRLFRPVRRRTWCCPTAASASRCGRRARTASSAAIARRSTSPMPATSSAWSTRVSSRSATRVHTGQPLRFPGVPRFPAEHFGRVRLKDTRYKQFDEGLQQLEEEGLMQVFYVGRGRREPIVGVVGALQFDVITSRLRTRVRRRGRHRAGDLHGRAMAGRSARQVHARRAGRSRRRSPRAEDDSVQLAMGARVLCASAPDRRAARRIAARMISFSKINKQYGKQVLFVDASFQLNEGEKVGLVGPNGSGKTTLFRMIVGEERSGRRRCVCSEEGDRRLFPPGRRGDVGPIGARRSDCRQRPARRSASRARRAAAGDGGSRAGRRAGCDARALRRGAGRIRASGRLRAREPHARDSARPRLRRRADRRRCRGAVGRLEDARGDGARAARRARHPADGRADEPSRHRIDHLARRFSEVANRRRC